MATNDAVLADDSSVFDKFVFLPGKIIFKTSVRFS